MKLSHGHQPACPSFLRFVPSANRVKFLFYNKTIHYKGIAETTKDPADCRNDNQRGQNYCDEIFIPRPFDSLRPQPRRGLLSSRQHKISRAEVSV